MDFKIYNDNLILLQSNCYGIFKFYNGSIIWGKIFNSDTKEIKYQKWQIYITND
jgi:hypothetical protein